MHSQSFSLLTSMRNQLSRFSNVGQQSGAGRHVPESYRWRNGANAVARIAQFHAEGPALLTECSRYSPPRLGLGVKWHVTPTMPLCRFVAIPPPERFVGPRRSPVRPATRGIGRLIRVSWSSSLSRWVAEGCVATEG